VAEVRLLRPDDDRSAFCSGDVDLDRFFTRFAGQNQFRHHIGATYVAVEGGRVLGFATVAPGEVEVKDLPEISRGRFPRYPLPVLRLARLAVDREAQGRGIGSLLLVTVFELAHELARTVGCVGVVVDAKAPAMPFYARLGFRPMVVRSGALEDRPVPIPMYLHLSAIPNLQKQRG
jgi:GNAT superfamily N-acetyltransferase